MIFHQSLSITEPGNILPFSPLAFCISKPSSRPSAWQRGWYTPSVLSFRYSKFGSYDKRIENRLFGNGSSYHKWSFDYPKPSQNECIPGPGPLIMQFWMGQGIASHNQYLSFAKQLISHITLWGRYMSSAERSLISEKIFVCCLVISIISPWLLLSMQKHKSFANRRRFQFRGGKIDSS